MPHAPARRPYLTGSGHEKEGNGGDMPVLLAGGIGLAPILVFVGVDRYMRTDDPAFENRLRRYALRQGGGESVAASVARP